MIENTIDYNPYILNDKNIVTYLKYKLNNKTSKTTIPNNNLERKTKPIHKEDIFFPKEQDSLFWCYYIISFGESNY